MPFQEQNQFVNNGEPVSAPVTNRAPQINDANIRYLKNLIDAAALGSTLFASDVTVEAAAQVGMPVYYNTVRQRFELGLAAASADPSTGVVTTADSSQVWGVVYSKGSMTLATLLVAGYATLDISLAAGSPVTAGTYYLSGVTAGRLVKQRPPVSVPVLRSDGNGKVFVVPQFVDFLDRHTHYRFGLSCRPAGDVAPPADGDRHVINNADASLPGWLPANHPIFSGMAPLGAVFGYNLSAHPSLNNAWPPLPVDQAYLEWDRALSKDSGFQGVPLGAAGLAIIDRYGLWWLSDCYGDVPWPIAFETGISESLSESPTPECPRHMAMAMTLWFSKAQFITTATSVTSLRANDPRVIVRCVDGSPATTGDLEIIVAFGGVAVNDEAGYLVIKSVDDEGGFSRGPIVEGMYALSSNVTFAGDLMGGRTIDGTERQVYQGLVGVSVGTVNLSELDIQLVRVDGVTEEFFEDTPYLGMVPAEDTAYRGKIHIPVMGIPANPVLRLRLRILGRGAGSLPQLTVTARRLPRPPAGMATPVDLPDASNEFAVVIDTSDILDSSNQYLEAESDPFSVAAGDVVLFTVARSASDGYPAEVGILQQTGILTGS